MSLPFLFKYLSNNFYYYLIILSISLNFPYYNHGPCYRKLSMATVLLFQVFQCTTIYFFKLMLYIKGMELILFLEQYDYIPMLTASEGAMIVIHDQSVMPFPGDNAISLKANSIINIGIKKVKCHIVVLQKCFLNFKKTRLLITVV